MILTFKPQLLIWARERAKLSVAALAKKMNVKEEHVLQWETDGKITLKQDQAIAEATEIAVGYLFLSKPPIDPDSQPPARHDFLVQV